MNIVNRPNNVFALKALFIFISLFSLSCSPNARKHQSASIAAIEAEYRRHRADLLLLVQWWLRDVWLHTLAAGKDLLKFPEISGAEAVARRLNPRQALENLQTLEQTQRLLHTNVQEALALEVSLLKLHF